MIDNILNTYEENRHTFHPEEETTVHVWKLDLLIGRIRELQAENARLKKQIDLLVCDVIENGNHPIASMSDCRMCEYQHFCERKPDQCDPVRKLCEAAVLKSCNPEETGE